ncbi:MAG: hypothetical protein KJT03_06350, partial [Verrucomicrobiae bacterium]|nr:hypothetical protein [Verrucomicrobiae bacterium]
MMKPQRCFAVVNFLFSFLLFQVVVAATLPVFPKEGRWSVATGWEDGWPAEWHHVAVSSRQEVGEWTIFEGSLQLPEGDFKLRDSSRVIDPETGLTEVRRRWDWTGDEPISRVTLSVRLSVEGMKEGRPFLPGISYYDNPAGQSVDATRIPVIQAAKGKRRGFYEEHRYPMAFAAAEGEVDGKLTVAVLHSLPSPVPNGHYEDQWWSLGLEYLEEGEVELALYSGAVASNGRNAIIKGHQRKFHDYDAAWMTFKPGQTVEKTFYMEAYLVDKRGAGFQKPLWTSIRLANPFNPDGFPPLREVIARKFADTLGRWRESDDYAGVKAFPEERNWIDLAWAGQSEAFAYPFLQIGQRFDLAEIEDHVQSGLDFITSSPFTDDGFSIRYDMDKQQWLDRRNPLSQGQAVNNMLDALRLARSNRNLDTSKWEAFLKRACDYHAEQVLARDWKPVSTNQGFLIAPLAKASELFSESRYLDAAKKAGKHYMQRHLSMDEPYWGGTLDARCEDKEGAWAAMQGFLTLYEVTKDKAFLDAAIHAGDVVLSYVYVWDVDLPAGRLTDHAFKTRGWTSVSVQNMHLDVYGVLCTSFFWKLGDYTGNSDYHKLARIMLVACGQLLDPLGSQGEQMHQTNYAQHY